MSRSGGKIEKFAGSNDADTVAWHAFNSGNETHPVGKKFPNELGIYDMSGNVWELCSDIYDVNYYTYSPKHNPQCTGDNPKNGRFPLQHTGGFSGIFGEIGQRKVRRGGSYDYSLNNCRSFRRGLADPLTRDMKNGLRLVRSTVP